MTDNRSQQWTAAHLRAARAALDDINPLWQLSAAEKIRAVCQAVEQKGLVLEKTVAVSVERAHKPLAPGK